MIDAEGSGDRTVEAKFRARKVKMAREYFVEVTGPNGQKHHVGHFDLRSSAQEWILRNAADWTPEPSDAGELSKRGPTTIQKQSA